MEPSHDLWALLDSQRDAKVAEIAEEWEQRLSSIPQLALLWLALAPSWTVMLAEACHFPGAEQGVRTLFTRLYKAGFCEYVSAPSLLDEGEDDTVRQMAASDNDCFNLTDAIRSEVLQRVIRDPQQGRDKLVSEMENIGRAILKAKERHVAVPPLIDRWATLASGDIIWQFEDHVIPLLAEDNLNEAQGWIEAARWIEAIVGAELTWVLERAARRLELRYRRSYDEQFLTRFLRRDEQIKAFTELLQGSDKRWALHYVGQGGVGKTMLMRYLTTRYFDEHNLRASICRIDFDYLNPDYPSRAPGLLLYQISQELRLYGGHGADKEFAHFDRQVRNLHERLGSTNIGNLMLDQVLADSDFNYLIQTFVRAIRRLPQPVVLILDTCEELAKIRPDGTIPENVRATFAILERIHDDLPSLRVVFSGRRPLARAGWGWDCPTSLQPERPYLLLYEIRGFTYDEAVHYLLEQAKVRVELVVPIIQKSLDNSGSIDIFRWWRKRDSPATVTRYNPFDLALYSGWVCEDTSITAEDILAPGIDRYIERRIIGRIRHPGVRALLPAVALLGTFDRETLRVVAHSDERIFNAIFQELANQEWLQLQQFTFWRVKSGLRERLYSYFREHNPHALAEARMLLLPYLERITLERPLSSLNVSHFDAALRLFEEDDPRRAAAWWARIEARFASEDNAYGWALTLIEQLLGEEGAVAESDSLTAAQDRKESTLRPAVLATYASAQLHSRPFASREATWKEVLIKLNRHPLPEGIVRLRMRALAGQVAARFSSDDLKELFQLLNNLQAADLDEQLAASCIAALEAAVEQAEKTARDFRLENGLPFVALLDKARISRELRAFALTLSGRICVLIKQRENARFHFMRALSLLPDLGSDQQHWLDWLAPEDLSARVRLEYVRALYPAVLSPQDVLTQVGDKIASEPLTTRDADRLGSAILLLRRATGLLPTSDQLSFLASIYTSYTLSRGLPLSNVHRAFQPFAMALAETLAARGEIGRALEILERHSLQAEQSSVDLDTVHAANRAKLRIVRRWRLRDEGYGFSNSLVKSSLLADQELLWSLDGLDGPKSPAPVWRGMSEKERLLWLHARWRTSYMLRFDRLEAAIKGISSVRPSPADARPPFAFFSWVLDLVEVRELTNSRVMAFTTRDVENRDIVNLVDDALKWVSYTARLLRRKWHNVNLVGDALEWVFRHPEPPLETIRLLLRAQTLRKQNAAHTRLHVSASLIERIGMGRAAEIALEEAEMLALRLPSRALPLFFLARTWFRGTNDRVGEIIAATCAALTLARLGRRAEIVPMLDRLITSYTHFFQAQFTDRKIETVANHVDLDGLTSTWPKEWRPWLVRLVACMIWARDDARRTERIVTLLEWLESHYGAHITTGETALPAEFDGWLVVPEQSAERSATGGDVSTIETPVRDSFVLDIRGKYDERNEIYAQINLSHRVQGKEIETYTAKPVVFSLLQSYKELALQCIELLPPLRERPIPDATTIELHTDEYSSAPCWEGLVSFWFEADSAGWNFRRIHCYRTVRERQVRAAASWNRISEILSITPHFSLQSLLAPIWRTISNDQLQFTAALSSDIFTPKRSSFSANILHLVANAHEANGSIFLDISADSPVEEVTVVRQSRGRLLRSEDLSKLFPKLTVCLLQSLPALPTGRSETDRENATYQRRFAAELQELGVPIVLAIPPLPEKTFPLVLSPFVTAFHQIDQLSLPVLLEALAKARKSITQGIQTAGGSREDMLETALDLCLYFAPQQK